MAVTEILCSFILVLEGKTGKEIPESSRLEFLEKFLAKKFALSNAENNASVPLNRRGIADLPLLRTLLAICQKSQKPSFWEMIDSYALLAYASLAASRSLLRQLLASLKIYSVGTDKKSDFYELWQQHKQLKTLEMSQA